MKTETMYQYLDRTQHLAGIRKERHTRRKGGKDMCYLIVDSRFGKIAMISQKLPAVTEFINDHLVGPEEPCGCE